MDRARRSEVAFYLQISSGVADTQMTGAHQRETRYSLDAFAWPCLALMGSRAVMEGGVASGV
jgi:hypothetical protein